MAHSVSTSSIVIYFVLGSLCAAVALPARRHIRQVAASQSQISITQLSMTDLTSTKAEGVTLGQCVPVRNVNVPTKLTVDGTLPGAYKIVTYSTPCSAVYAVEISEATVDSTLMVNERHPICSFYLGRDVDTSQLTSVTFHEDQSVNSIKYSSSVGDQRCVNICSSSSWTKYAEVVRIQMNDQQTTNHIRLFSDTECNVQPPLKSNIVVDGSDLTTLTRKDSASIVQSFIILQPDDYNGSLNPTHQLDKKVIQQVSPTSLPAGKFNLLKKLYFLLLAL